MEDDAKDLRVVLNREDFSLLVNGKEVVKPGLRIILSDIGFEVMLREMAKGGGSMLRCARDLPEAERARAFQENWVIVEWMWL
jgi:hypothetical protein